MDYTIKSSFCDTYLLVRIEGEWSSINADKIIKHISDLMTSNNCSMILVDIRKMTSEESVIGDFQDANKLLTLNNRILNGFAVLDNSCRKQHNDFFENVAINRGLRIRFFYAEEQEAINWLHK